jgi:hypothetical protein
MAESLRLAEIRQRIGCRRDVKHVRINVGEISGTHHRSTSVNGVPDLLMVVTVLGIGIAGGIEVKDRARCRCPALPTPPPPYCRLQSKPQRVAQRVLRGQGGICFVAHDADEAESLLGFWIERKRREICAHACAGDGHGQ